VSFYVVGEANIKVVSELVDYDEDADEIDQMYEAEQEFNSSVQVAFDSGRGDYDYRIVEADSEEDAWDL